MLQLREGVWTLTDLGSTHGSAVDDEPVTEETPLSPGATIRLGEVGISFEPNDERADFVPVINHALSSGGGAGGLFPGDEPLPAEQNGLPTPLAHDFFV